MTILAESTSWVSIIESVLLVVHVVICILLCLVVLMQRPKQEGLGAAFGGGMTDQAFGARTTDVLQKGTVYLASLLFIITLTLSIMVGSESTAATISGENESNTKAAVEDFGAAAAAAAEDGTDELADALEAITGEKEDKENAKEDEKDGEAEAPKTDEPAPPAETEAETESGTETEETPGE